MTEWDGVRNPTAVNFIKTMKPGDRVIIYHSQGEICGRRLAEAASDPRPDKNDAMSWVADFEVPAPREEARDPERDQGVTSVRRLAARSPGSPSTMSAPAEFWKWLQKRCVLNDSPEGKTTRKTYARSFCPPLDAPASRRTRRPKGGIRTLLGWTERAGRLASARSSASNNNPMAARAAHVLRSSSATRWSPAGSRRVPAPPCRARRICPRRCWNASIAHVCGSMQQPVQACRRRRGRRSRSTPSSTQRLPAYTGRLSRMRVTRIDPPFSQPRILAQVVEFVHREQSPGRIMRVEFIHPIGVNLHANIVPGTNVASEPRMPTRRRQERRLVRRSDPISNHRPSSKTEIEWEHDACHGHALPVSESCITARFSSCLTTSHGRSNVNPWSA